LYEKGNALSKAKYYNELAYALAEAKRNEGWMGMSLNNAGNTFVKTKEFAQASDHYHRAIPYLKQDNNISFLCESYLGLSSILFHSGKWDSSVQYAKNAFRLASGSNLGNYYLQSCQLLTNIYRAENMADSALVYQDRLVSMKDSLYSRAKIKQVESLTISEKLRQQERQQQILQEKKERSYKLNMLLVGLMIPLSFLVSVLLSKRKVKKRFVEFSGILSLLLFFEYLMLLIHPAVTNLTNHSPFFEIIILVIVAAILTPAHHRLEHWVLHQLTKKAHETPVAPEAPADVPESPMPVHDME
jgi:tetratricopeptide (TPR) repeat protein